MALSRYHQQIIATREVARAKWQPREILLPSQLAVFDDPAAYRLVDGPRRIGKSKLAAVMLLDMALSHPRARCLFLALTREDARDIVWAELLELNNDYALGFKVDLARLELSHPENGSRIRVGGAKDRQQAERWRGRFYRLVIIDEAQTFPSHLMDLVESILKPSLLGKGGRTRRGKIVLMGTPGEIPGVGYWEERVASTLWSKHSWDTYDNTHLGTKEEIDEILADIAESMGGVDEPKFQREMRGKRVPPKNIDRPYIYDVTKQDFVTSVIESEETKTLRYTRWALPLGGAWKFVFGVDLGRVAASAIVVWGMTDAAPGVVWLVEEYVSVKLLPDTLWAKISERRAVYHPLEMAVDEGGLGGMIAEQWRSPPYSLPVVAADKLAPEVQADFLSAAMSRSAVKIVKSSRMAQDMAVARWDSKKLLLNKRVEALSPHSDVIPAGRYGFKKAHQIAVSMRAPETPKTVQQKEDAALVQERREGAERAQRLMRGLPPSGAREALQKWRR